MALATCVMCAACAYGFGGIVISVFIAAVCAGMALLAHPLLILAPATAAVVPLFFGGALDGTAAALGAVSAGALIYAAFRRGADLTLAGAVSGVAMLVGTAVSVVIMLKTQSGGVTAGIAALKESLMGTLRQMADAASSAYGGGVQIYDSDIENIIADFAMMLPGMALFLYQLVGMLSASLTASVMRLCGAGADVSSDGRWRCADRAPAAAMYILSQVFFAVSALFGRSVVYYASYNIMTAFLPAALAMGVRAMFTRRGVPIQPMLRVGATVLAAMSVCYNPMAALQIIATVGGGAVLYRVFYDMRKKGGYR